MALFYQKFVGKYKTPLVKAVFFVNLVEEFIYSELMS